MTLPYVLPFHDIVLYINGMIIKKIASKLYDYFVKVKKTHEFKKANKHNFLSLKAENYRTININKIHCGKHSYGTLFIDAYGDSKEGLTIGSYCSISGSVKFILGGNHSSTHLLSYPFKAMEKGENEAFSKGPIVVKDDVWIANNVIILSGVTIGQGAIVGAGTVISQNIPPYSVVCGNPAKIVKKRFSDPIIEKLLLCDLSDLSTISRGILYENITLDNIDDIIAVLPHKK